MGEAKINAAINRAARNLPTPEQMKALEALSARFADALWAEGMKLSGPTPHVMTRMLVLVTAGRVLAKIGDELKENAEAVQDAAAAGARQAVYIAQRQAIVEAGRKLALAGEG